MKVVVHFRENRRMVAALLAIVGMVAAVICLESSRNRDTAASSSIDRGRSQLSEETVMTLSIDETVSGSKLVADEADSDGRPLASPEIPAAAEFPTVWKIPLRVPQRLAQALPQYCALSEHLGTAPFDNAIIEAYVYPDDVLLITTGISRLQIGSGEIPVKTASGEQLWYAINVEESRDDVTSRGRRLAGRVWLRIGQTDRFGFDFDAEIMLPSSSKTGTHEPAQAAIRWNGPVREDDSSR